MGAFDAGGFDDGFFVDEESSYSEDDIGTVPLQRVLRRCRDLQRFCNANVLSTGKEVGRDMQYVGRAMVALGELMDALAEAGMPIDLPQPKYINQLNPTVEEIFNQLRRFGYLAD